MRQTVFCPCLALDQETGKYPHPYWKHFWHGPSVGAWPSVGVGCMAMLAAFPSTNMDSTRIEPAGTEGAGSILVDEKASNVAMQPTPTEGHTPTEGPMPKMLPVGVGYFSIY